MMSAVKVVVFPVALSGILLELFLGCESVAAQTSLSTFNPFPVEKVRDAKNGPDERQLQLFFAILQGSETIDPISACEELMTADFPNEVWQWLFLQRIPLYSYASREDVAVSIAEEWLAYYPDHPVNLKLYNILLQFYAWRGSPAFQPTLSDLRRLGTEMFNADRFPQTDRDVIDAHFEFAQALKRFYRKGHGAAVLLDEAREHLLEARSLLQKMAERSVQVPDKRITPGFLARYLDLADVKIDEISSVLESLHSTVDSKQVYVEAAVEGVWDALCMQ